MTEIISSQDFTRPFVKKSISETAAAVAHNMPTTPSNETAKIIEKIFDRVYPTIEPAIKSKLEEFMKTNGHTESKENAQDSINERPIVEVASIEALNDAIRMLKDSTDFPKDKTVKDLLEDKMLQQIINSPQTKEKLDEWLKKYISVRSVHK